MNQSMPLIEELSRAPKPFEVLRHLAHLSHAVFFDSALKRPELGRYSYVAADPIAVVRSGAGDRGSFERLAALLAPYEGEYEGPAPFCGGLAGVAGYELGRELERLPSALHDEFAVPTLVAGVYDVAVVFDHLEDRAWIVSHGWPESEASRRADRSRRRRDQFLKLLGDPPLHQEQAPGAPLDASRLAPQFATDRHPGLTTDFGPGGYQRAVQRAIDYIHAGDVFQVNLSQRLMSKQRWDALELYGRLRETNPAPFAGFFDLGGVQVLSASPERFLRIDRGAVETRPIKGTRPRLEAPDEDLAMAAALHKDAKDRAENVMIVDLLRNDLSRVSVDCSVEVPSLLEIESYADVHHLVSVVRSRLAPGYKPLDALRAAFPGGSITGAPKVRAMEIIAELEPTARGPYCGSLFYAGFNGAMDSSILIRTIVQAQGWLQLSVGGGVVAQSDPDKEHEETWQKAAGLLRAIGA